MHKIIKYNDLGSRLHSRLTSIITLYGRQPLTPPILREIHSEAIRVINETLGGELPGLENPVTVVVDPLGQSVFLRFDPFVLRVITEPVA